MNNDVKTGLRIIEQLVSKNIFKYEKLNKDINEEYISGVMSTDPYLFIFNGLFKINNNKRYYNDQEFDVKTITTYIRGKRNVRYLINNSNTNKSFLLNRINYYELNTDKEINKLRELLNNTF